METYSPAKIEKKWQKVWEENGLYQAEDKTPGVNGHDSGSQSKPKFYALVEFPYPSGAGLHVGHVRAWSAMDAYVRQKRMEGFNVLFPIGWDAFGLPAENYAIKMGVHPSITTQENIETFKKQIKSLGLSFDWSREINTTDPKYYKWTQWIFLKLLEKGLAYQKEVPVNWCPRCKTNLADEEVLSDGTHERCGKATEKRLQKQWLLAITKYANRLIEDLKSVDFPSKVSVQQVNWIGRKEGINITYDIDGLDEKVTVFTTTPVNFGATFIVISPEHALVSKLLHSSPRHPELVSVSTPSVMPDRDLASRPMSLDSGSPSGMTVAMDKTRLEEIRKYVEQAKSKSEAERVAEGREKTGVFTGLYAVNHVTGKNIPIWISDFVLSNVGTGAVQGCPGHDKRDWDFAKKFGLPIVRVVSSPEGIDPDINDEPFIVHVGDSGVMVNSDFLNGVGFSEAMSKTMDYFAEKGWGKRTVTYHLHDWIFSRQHYWGEPIPVVHCEKCGVVPVSEKDLPVELPYVEKYEPSGTGESPLASIGDWVNTKCPNCGGAAKRETDTMPNWAGSNWYYLGYLISNSLGNSKSQTISPVIPVKTGIQSQESLPAGQVSLDPRSRSGMTREQDSDPMDVFTTNKYIIDRWMPVDIYEGGYEHTTLHLLYSRFIYKFLYDIGVVPGPEPYARRRVHGVVLGPDGRKMSKSLGNVINPDEIVEKFGADSLRLYEMFMGPYAESVAWNINGVVGVYRFLSKVWMLFISTDFSFKTVEEKPDGFKASTRRVEESTVKGKVNIMLSKLVKKVSSDLENMKFNTAVSSFMEFTNELTTQNSQLTTHQWDIFLRVLAPFAPHLSEELYQRLHVDQIPDLTDKDPGSFWSVHNQSWPEIESIKSEEDLTIVVQVDGKVRDTIRIKNSEVRIKDEKIIESEALKSENVKKHLGGKPYKTIYVPGKVINFVVAVS